MAAVTISVCLVYGTLIRSLGTREQVVPPDPRVDVKVCMDITLRAARWDVALLDSDVTLAPPTGPHRLHP